MPDNAMAFSNLGLALGKVGRLEEAIEYSRRAERINPNELGVHLTLIRYYFEPAKAMSPTAVGNRSLPRGPPRNPLKVMFRAVRACELTVRSGAHGFRSHRLCSPLSLRSFVGLGLSLGYALMRQGKSEEALSAYRRACRIAPYPSSSLTHLGRGLIREGKVAQSIAMFREAVRMDRNDAYGHYYLGYALLLQRKAEEAVPVLTQALRLNPKDPQILKKLNGAMMMKQCPRSRPRGALLL